MKMVENQHTFLCAPTATGILRLPHFFLPLLHHFLILWFFADPFHALHMVTARTIHHQTHHHHHHNNNNHDHHPSQHDDVTQHDVFPRSLPEDVCRSMLLTPQIRLRSTCPWHYVEEFRADREPSVILKAVLSCGDTCLTMRGDGTKINTTTTPANTGNDALFSSCLPIVRYENVRYFNNAVGSHPTSGEQPRSGHDDVGCSGSGNNSSGTEWLPVPFAFTCASSSSSSSSP
ncbi:uncharacterized protein LOC143293579 [Babylonia areolata]|uniref:uncharacterized protein LOC143293579 n=1 Tax=Babylonia areolata TaxID=304850 RepID=UPI003FD5D8E3